ncbi:MAG: MerR family transcriptional regulator [Actinomycetota bacterium]|nr:MerR family transcriptional regulator [Actinomycetota bacterium]
MPQSIGAVLAQLTPDFPDLTISKIRFLEAEGLLTPDRTASGYRTYRREDVERLRYVLTAQRDRFWPLKVIRDALDALDRGLSPLEPTSASGGPGIPGVAGSAEIADGSSAAGSGRPRAPQPVDDPLVPSIADLTTPSVLRLTSRELRDEAGLDRVTFDALENFGLVRPNADGHFDEDALAIARAAAALAAYGVEPRHLRPFRTAADREIGLVQQISRPARPARTSGEGGGDGATPEGGDPTPQILRLFLGLHAALLRAGLGTTSRSDLRRPGAAK